ncbi:bactoprenol glucosyl transferase [Amylibacter ulvae]|uniref:Bactoprenol glucosyl transferase n=1 Tax=Paramylibacter ulvae TaxID=1651968 RepID=A0ABQ3DBM2_9RHOB|nr:glycosyltransferase family 2 protein [Amylibacter ulvae]GHA60899.1 bactoprenol glucosyl transferase [Amylibacter ulvae]
MNEDKRMTETLPKLALIVPVFNEEQAIAPFVNKIADVLVGFSNKATIEICFVNDGSTDKTEQIIDEISQSTLNIKTINLSRNFGKEAALSAGLDYTDADAVIPIDVDLQDPPELIPEMFNLWMNGAQIVNARRITRDQDTWLKRTSAGAFYKIFNILADHPIPRNVGDFRLLDREVVEVVRQLGERSRFNKALFSWVGFETAELTHERPARADGESAWSYWKLWKLALDGIFSSSTTPLRVWSYIGVLMGVMSFTYSAYILIKTLAFGGDVPGYASTIILILTFGGFNLFALGIIGEYVGRIYTEVRQRPLYVLRQGRLRGKNDMHLNEIKQTKIERKQT